jgi:alpha-beta hydrolase superfamily lysophospholipase
MKGNMGGVWRFVALLCVLVPLLTACDVAADPIPAPTATPIGHVVFGTADGVRLDGQLFGQGRTAIVFSNGFGAVKEWWGAIPKQLAGLGYLALVYDYRGTGGSKASDSPNDPEARDRDLRGAVAYVRARGATAVMLIGASFGGLLSIKLAAELQPAALVILSAPLTTSTLSVSDDELRAVAAPKLFMVSQDDTLFAGDVQHMYDVAPPPKLIQVYPGAEHGMTILTNAATNADATQRVESFILQYAPPLS